VRSRATVVGVAIEPAGLIAKRCSACGDPRSIAGSGIELLDKGEHELKGVPGIWRLFSVRD
jgi:hypothetical protein